AVCAPRVKYGYGAGTSAAFPHDARTDGCRCCSPSRLRSLRQPSPHRGHASAASTRRGGFRLFSHRRVLCAAGDAFATCRKFNDYPSPTPLTENGFPAGYADSDVQFASLSLREDAVSSGKQSIKRSFVFFLVPDFTMVAFATALDPLRIANRMLGYEAYKWRLTSIDGKPVRASNGVECAVDTSLDEERRRMAGAERPSMVIVCSGLNVETYREKSVYAWLRETHNRGIAVGGLCTGAHVLAQAGLLSGRRCAIHWENLPGFAEAFPKVNVYADLFEVDANIYTCAGGTSALDMMLKLIGEDFDDALVNKICDQFLTDRVRRPTDRQR